MSFSKLMTAVASVTSRTSNSGIDQVAVGAAGKAPGDKDAPKLYADAANLSGPVALEDIVPLTSRIKRDRSFIRKRGNDKIRVLSVDDDPVNQMVVQTLLSADTYEVGALMGSCARSRSGCC